MILVASNSRCCIEASPPTTPLSRPVVSIMTMFLFGSVGLILASFTAGCCFEEEDAGESISKILFGQKSSARRQLLEKKEVEYLSQYFCATTVDDDNDESCDARCGNRYRASKRRSNPSPSSRGSLSTQRVVHQLFLGDLYR